MRSTTIPLLTATISSLLAVPLCGQNASVTSYGVPCATANAGPLTATLPALGQTMYFNWPGGFGNGTTNWQGYVMLGLSPQSAPFVDPTFAAMGFGCTMLVTPDLLLTGMWGGVPLSIPNVPAYMGFQFYAQGFKLGHTFGNHGLNYFWITFSDGLAFTVGT